MYHEAADEWPVGNTPPEVKEKYQAKVQAIVELWNITSDDGSDKENNDNGVGARVGSEKAVAAPYQADWLPTPSLSAESLRATPHKRKRRRISEEGDEETERPVKTRAKKSPLQKAICPTHHSAARSKAATGSRRGRRKGEQGAASQGSNHHHWPEQQTGWENFDQDDQLVDDAASVATLPLGRSRFRY